jgi:CheY-like chemotaxis protein
LSVADSRRTQEDSGNVTGRRLAISAIPSRTTSVEHSRETGPATRTGTGATVLVVDDDPAILGLLELLLTRAGYSVLTAANGREAIDRFRESRAAVGLVLLDILMPDLDGPATVAELHQLDPGLVCCFMSGHSGRYNDDDLLALGAQGFLAKPFRPDDLLYTVGRLLTPRVSS